MLFFHLYTFDNIYIHFFTKCVLNDKSMEKQRKT